MPEGLNILTHSRMQEWKTCPRKHELKYLIGLRKKRKSDVLRFGGNFHEGLDLLAQGIDIDTVCRATRYAYDDAPPWVLMLPIDEYYDWMAECEQVCTMLRAYVWRWQDDPSVVLQTETTFDLPIRNPDTGKCSRAHRISGKIDKIIQVDNQIILREHKTTGDSIAPDSDYWKRVRLDHQISLYFMAAKECGFDVEHIEYDVIHRPGIQPQRKTPLDKIRYKKDGTLYANCREKNEIMSEYGDRLLNDVYDRPDFYFQRKPVPRLESDIDEFRHDLWCQHKAMLSGEREGWHFKNTVACTQPYRCEYLDICHGAIDLDRELPDGFEIVDHVHQELIHVATPNIAVETTKQPAVTTEVEWQGPGADEPVDTEALDAGIPF